AAPHRRAFLAAHPEYADEIGEFLASYQQLNRMVTPLRDAGQALQAKSTEAPGTPGDQGAPAELGQLGDYRLLREIGRGGMGVVYEAEQLSLGRRVALKILPFAAALDAKQLQRFKNEAMAAAQLHHQNIVPVYGVGCERGVHYYAMQFIDGQTLAALIVELRQLSGLDAQNPAGPAHTVSELARVLVSGQWASAKAPVAEPPPTGPYPSRPATEGVAVAARDAP